MPRTPLLVGLCLCALGVLAALFVPLDRFGERREGSPQVVPSGELPRKAEVIALLQEGRFGDLETIYSLNLAPDGKSATNTLHRFRAFEYADPELAPHLSRWAAAQDPSPLPHLARGNYHLHLAYTVRGQEVAAKTSAEQFDQMRHFLEKARQDFQRALDLGPPSVAAYEGLMNIAITNGKRGEASRILNTALASTDNPLPLHAAYMRSLQTLWGGSNDVLWDYWVALRRGGTLRQSNRDLDFTTAMLKAAKARAAGRLESALAHYEAAVELRSDRKGAIPHARTLAGLDRFEEAIGVLNAGLEAAPDSAPHHFDKAALLWYTNRPAEAVAAIQEALRLDPYNPEMRLFSYNMSKTERLRRQRNGEVADPEGDNLPGGQDVEAAMVYGSARSDVQLAWARHLLGKGRPREEAYAAFERARALSPRDPEYLLAHAVAMSANDDCRALRLLRDFERMCKRGADCSKYIDVGILKDDLAWCAHSPDRRPPQPQPSTADAMTSCKADFTEASPETARALCTRRAEAGDAGAAYDMGSVYALGFGVDVNHATAVDWFTHAADQGHLEAMNALGNLVYRGWGAPRDIERGISLIEQAAQADNTNAMVSLGLLYYHGKANDRDLRQSRRWLSRAAKLGNEDARMALRSFFGADNHATTAQ